MNTKDRSAGFTLIEVMVVMVIIAILAAIIVPNIMSRPEQAKMVKAKQDILAIENAMELYRLDNGDYPSDAQGIASLIIKPTTKPIPENWQHGGYLKHQVNDPWGHPYHYRNPGEHADIDIFTYAPHHNKKTKRMIGNWNIQANNQN